jgi:hypothetical protein
MPSLVYFLVACLLGIAFGAPSGTSGNAWPRSEESTAVPPGSPIPPKEDPWYTPPDGYESATPGEVLRVRIAQGELGQTLDSLGAAYNILYRTTNSNADPSWAVTTLLVPRKPSKTSNSLLSYQVPYDSADLDAGPSYTLSQFAPHGRTPGNCVSEIDNALAAGYYVTVPDYEGPLASCASILSPLPRHINLVK